MRKINAVRQERAILHDRNKSLLALVEVPQDERPGKLTDEQINAEYEDNDKKIAVLDAEIAEIEKWHDRRQAVSARDVQLDSSVGAPVPPHGESGNATPVSGDDDRHPAGLQGYHLDIARHYHGRTRHIQGERHGRSAQERAYRMGMWGLYIASVTLPHRYRFPKAIKFAEEQGLIVHGEGAADTTGAHLLVPDELSTDMIDLKESRGVVRRLFGREAMTRETKTIPRRKTGLTAYAVGENAAGTESDMTMDDVMLIARKWMVLTRFSKELDEDSIINFGDKLAGEIAYAFADKEDEAGFNGDGTNTYHGIQGVRSRLQDVDGAGTDSAGLITGAGNAYSELTLSNFEEVAGTLPDFADASAVWVVHKKVFYTVMLRLALAQGGSTATEAQQGDRRGRPIFLGYPVEFSQVFPKTEANSQVCAVLGDFNIGASFGDRRGDMIEFDDTVNVGGQSVWERDQIAVKGTERFDIVVHEVGTSTVAGAIVGLQTAAS